ncbi:hypothetical protein C7271_09255 [filamentous cyanobacterium CCP5]|nr:hypothetical protein C7271_09255 [filamentous cyanobacterium CCP5]
MTAEQKQLARREYGYGQDAFERGNYRNAVEHFEKAVALVKPTTILGGKVQTWLVEAYAAAGRRKEAIALCEKLSRHPDPETKKKGKSLLYILNAPRLSTRREWMSEIPDLAAISDKGGDNSGLYSRAPKGKRSPKQDLDDLEPIDWSQINTEENSFVWVALAGIALVMIGLAWLA